MKRIAIGVVTILLLASGPATAHEKFRIVGTIVTVHAAQLDVKAADGQTYEIDMDEKTIVTRDGAKVPASSMQPGGDVVVEAIGHDVFDLVAVDVQLKGR